ncbi:MAG: hypothetical protein ACPG05_00585, partial [Bdellovibrionales bacterium]
MTTSGLIGGTSAAQIKASSQQIAVRLINIPNNLQNSSQPISINGEVIGRGPDKTLLLKTDHGEVTIQTKGALNAREGQRLQVDIPANGGRETVVRPSLNNALEVKQQENTSLLKVVADKLVSLTRKAELSANNLTQSQTLVGADKTPIKTADLTIGTSVRLSPVPSVNSLGIYSNTSQVINTQLQGQLFLNQGFQTMLTGGVVYQGVSSQSALIGTVLGLNNTSSSQVNVLPQGIGQGAGQQLNIPYLGQLTGQSGSVNTGQSFAFPPSGGLDVKFSGQGSFLFGGGNAFSSFGGGLGNSGFLLNGQAGQLIFQVTGFTTEQQPIVRPVVATHISGHTNPNPPSFVMQFPTNSLALGNILSFSSVGGSLLGSGIVPIDQFSSLMIALKELQAVNPASAKALSVLTPSVNMPQQQTGAAMLFLLSALKGGGLENWMGDGSGKLSAKHKILQLLEQTLRDGANPRLVSNTPVGDWRAYSIPLQLQDATVPV